MSATKTILVTAATAATGKATVAALVGREGITVHAGVRDLEKGREALSEFVKQGVELVEFDLSKPETAVTYDAVLVIPPGVENRGELGATAINAFRKISEATRTVLLSVISAEGPLNDHSITFARQFNVAETALRSSGSHWVSVQLGMFFENFLGQPIGTAGVLVIPFGAEGKFPAESVIDAGKALAAALTKDAADVEGKTFAVTGSVAHTGQEWSDEFTKGLGRKVEFVDPPSADWVAGAVKSGFPEWQAKGMVELFDLGRAGWLQPATGFKDLTGAEPMTTQELIAHYKSVWLPSA